MEKKATYANTRYGEGSTGFHAAIPPQVSDGGSGGVPHRLFTPLLPKPAVLATLRPEPSHGTPGTAIGAIVHYTGPALPRPQHGDVDVEQPPANRWKTLVKRVNAKVKQWRAQIHRYYLARMRNHVALTTKLTFGYVRLIVFTISILRRMLFHKSALPFGVINLSIHDRRYALFRRRAVGYASGGGGISTIQHHYPLQCVGAGAQSTDTRLTNTYFKLKR